ncbi:ABC transporter ATP-binding protein [Paenibacillus sp. VTT E-133280]|jgi:ABC-2 type transport system ATP-binding protein|uniref:ABC transporter ATP-binding protein n=1 Tax=Paenibacillus TaxID=44249 RepID=UPI000B9FA0BA|nr:MULTISPECIES: ABC transporter ATP-binding protein [unclassified Paenibacillus]MDH6369539.1 ABC-2 type transport system ATP-binding protein [Paenibacillus sp. PastF-3]OZQ58223.1 ABC transporter ATP-binding protein [Paenibacillus sp. VTT E-133280]
MTKANSDESSPVVLSVDGVRKKIGRKWIIDDVTFDVRKGEIFGFLGPNGAGKTTTIRMLVDLIRPSEGKITVCGYNVNRNPEKALQFVGSIVENPEVYTYLTGWENLQHFARMQPGIDNTRISEVVDIVRLDQRIHDKVSTYSLGMRQRLGIAQALLGHPRLLILDEPTNGLDPKGIKELREFIRKLADEGLAVFVSSHLLSEIQLLCDRVAIISKGRVLAVGSVDELIARNSPYVLWELEPFAEARTLLADRPDIQIQNLEDVTLDDSIIAGMGPNSLITIMEQDLIPEIVAVMVTAEIEVRAVHKINPTLEQLFLKLTEGENVE